MLAEQDLQPGTDHRGYSTGHASDPPLRQYLEIFKRQLSLVILIPLMTVAAVNVLLELKDPVYRAATTLVVGEPSGGAEPPDLASTSVTRTMTSLLESEYVARSVIDKLRIDVTMAEFREHLKVEVLPDTAVLDVSYTSKDRKLALGVVTEINRIFQRQLGDALGVSKGIPGRATAGSFELIVRAFDPPHVGASPPTSRVTTLVIAGMGGILLGLMFAVARDSLDFRIRSRREAEDWFGAPVIGALPKGPRSAMLFGSGRADRHANSLDLLRARLQFSQLAIGGPTILVTSARPREGKSSVAASLAAGLARAGNRVICVDADLRRPSLPGRLGVPVDGPGLVEVMSGKAPLEEVLVEVDPAGAAGSPERAAAGPGDGRPRSGAGSSRLEVLPAGAVGDAYAGIFSPGPVVALIEHLRERADYVVFDSPPLMVADSFALALQSDNVLLVTRRGRTTRGQAQSARATLDALGVHNISVVLTDAPPVETYT